MRILALNTAFSNSDVALLFDGKQDFASLNSSAKHSENILVCTDDLLKKNNVKIQDIETISVVIGPGSFTGIRIGVGLVKGMYVAKPTLKLVSICSLDLMSYIYSKNSDQKEYWCALDALSGNIYVCKYSNGKRVTKPQMLTGESLSELSGIIVGLEDENLNFCTSFVKFTPKALLDYTAQKCNNNEYVQENELLPMYLRKSQAEVGLENANKKN